MKKLSALLVITMLLSACAVQPEQTTTAENTTASITTASETTATTEITTTTAETTVTTTITEKAEEEMSYFAYLDGYYGGAKHLQLDEAYHGDNYNIFLCAENYTITPSDDGVTETVTAEKYQLIAAKDLVIEKIYELPFPAGQLSFKNSVLNRCLSYYKLNLDYLLSLRLPAETGAEVYFLVYKDGEFVFFNDEPLDIGADFIFDRENYTFSDPEKQVEYTFDIENMTYSVTEIPSFEMKEYAPVISMDENSKLDFLTEEQNEVWMKSKFIKSFSVSSGNAQLPYSNEEVTADFYMPTDISYKSFADFINSVFTEDAFDSVTTSSFKDVNGFVYWIDGARGGDLDYRGCDFELVSKDENTIKFKCIAYYNNGPVYTEYTEGDPYNCTLEYPIEMVNTENGWRMKYYDLWY